MLVARGHLRKTRRPGGAGVLLPTQFAQPTTMATIPTAWGMCGFLWRDRENENSQAFFTERPEGALLCRIWTPGLSASELRAEILRVYPRCHEVLGEGVHFHPEVVPEWFNDLVKYLQGYYTAALRGWTHPQFIDNWAYWKPRLDWSQVTPFPRQVLEVVGTIPSGMSMSYGQVAARIGKPAASRAVGAAIRSNPWPVLIPCHRVVGSTGKLTGFSAPGGIDAKRRMLDMERG
jgi:O-6-methylguanine DNA methyltransferase